MIIKLVPSHCNQQIKQLNNRMICLCEIVLDSSQAVQDSFATGFSDERTRYDYVYLKRSGNFSKTKPRSLPRRPGSRGLTQMSRQTAAPMKKQKMRTSATTSIYTSIPIIQNYILKMQSQPNRNTYYFQTTYTNPYFPEQGRGSLQRDKSKKLRRPKRQPYRNTSESNQQYFPQTNQRPIYTQRSANNSSSNTSRSQRKKIHYKFKRNQSFDQSIRSSSNYSKQSFEVKSELSKQINRLNGLIATKQKELKGKGLHTNDKAKDNQIHQLYRVINYYEGKTQGMEMQLKRYEQILLKIGSMCEGEKKREAQVEEIVAVFEEMRVQNEDLMGKIEEKDYDIGMITDKLRKSELKIGFLSKFQSKSHLSQTARRDFKNETIGSNSKKATREAINDRESYGNIQSKLNSIELNLKYLRKKNQKLSQELKQKDKIIQQYEKTLGNNPKKEQRTPVTVKGSYAGSEKIATDTHSKVSRTNRVHKNQEQFLQQQRRSSDSLVKDNQSSKKSYTKDDPLNKVIFLPHNMLRQINKPNSVIQKEREIPPEIVAQKQQQNNQVDEKAIASKVYTKLCSQNRPKVFHKLRLQIMTEQISHEDAIQRLIDEELEPETLQEQQMYNLGSEEAQWVIDYISQARSLIGKQIKESGTIEAFEQKQAIQKALVEFMKKVFVAYKELTLKQENNFKIQIYNTAMNRLEEFDELIESIEKGQKSDKMEYQQYYSYFKGWGLLDSQVDVLSKAYYEKTRSIDDFSLTQTRELILSWGK